MTKPPSQSKRTYWLAKQHYWLTKKSNQQTKLLTTGLSIINGWLVGLNLTKHGYTGIATKLKASINVLLSTILSLIGDKY